MPLQSPNAALLVSHTMQGVTYTDTVYIKQYLNTCLAYMIQNFTCSGTMGSSQTAHLGAYFLQERMNKCSIHIHILNMD